MHDLLNLYDLYELLILCYLDEPVQNFSEIWEINITYI